MLLENLLLFGRLLRGAGLGVSLGQTLDFARALEWVDLGDREQVFHAARSFLVNRHEDLRLFEILFDRFWRRESGDPLRSAGPPRPGPRPSERKRFDAVSFLSARTRRLGPEIEIETNDRSETYSDLEILRRKDFAGLSPEELDEVRRLIQETEWRMSLRATRRWAPDARGPRIHLRRMLRDAAKHGGAPLRLARRSRKKRQRPVVLLADISGSMENYSRIILQFFYGALHGLADVECFVFGTRLTRITTQLRARNIDWALDDASRRILDWSGGTRIGASIGAFNRHWSKRVLRRGAIVLVVSDGWERGDIAGLRREMRYLHHRCHRLIWLNPHAGRPGYEPLVEGMANALPFVDDFLPIHNLDSLRSLVRILAALPARRGAARPNRAAIPALRS